MTKIREIYKCNICGNIVEALHAGVGELVCCGEPMELMKEKTEDSSIEKHVPYIEKTENGVLVKIGQNQEHPMEEKHHIEWIQVIADGISYRKFLKPGDKPQAEFEIKADKIETREYCNIHGLWRS
ncbi:desulfoferrodoxin [Thermoplasmatales archaeon SCGC AB-540-F20]|nr:desulfoferrodoxin [Thermoplasmatales archaeon SCGC AB-540-F20]